MGLLRNIINRTGRLFIGKSFGFWSPLLGPILVYVTLEQAMAWDYLQHWIFLLLLTAAMVPIFVTTHRLLLLGSDSVPDFGFGLWTRREVHFFAYMLIINYALPMLSFVAIFLPIEAAIPVMAVLALAGLFAAARCSLVLPATAIEERIFLSDSWKMTRNHKITMIGIVLVIPIATAAPAVLLGLFESNLFTPLVSIATALGYVLAAAFLSIAYREIIAT